MLIAVGLLVFYLAGVVLTVNHLLIIITLPLAVTAAFIYTRSQCCPECGKGIFNYNLGPQVYVWGIFYFPLECPHCKSHL